MLQAKSVLNRLEENASCQEGESVGRESVEIETIDRFCSDRGIEHVSYVKIDTEGSDFKVLLGVEKMLRDGRIDFVEVEAGFNPENRLHVPAFRFVEHMRELGYHLFGVYEQERDAVNRRCSLRRANLVFINKELVRHYDEAP